MHSLVSRNLDDSTVEHLETKLYSLAFEGRWNVLMVPRPRKEIRLIVKDPVRVTRNNTESQPVRWPDKKVGDGYAVTQDVSTS